MMACDGDGEYAGCEVAFFVEKQAKAGYVVLRRNVIAFVVAAYYTNRGCTAPCPVCQPCYVWESCALSKILNWPKPLLALPAWCSKINPKMNM